jgi:hypothetical protein
MYVAINSRFLCGFQPDSLFINVWGLKVRIMSRSTVRHLSGAHGQIFITVTQLRLCWCEGESLVYNCCWSTPAQLFLGPSPAGLTTVFCCHIQDSLIQEQGSPAIPLGTGLLFCRFIQRLDDSQKIRRVAVAQTNWLTTFTDILTVLDSHETCDHILCAKCRVLCC